MTTPTASDLRLTWTVGVADEEYATATFGTSLALAVQPDRYSDGFAWTVEYVDRYDEGHVVFAGVEDTMIAAQLTAEYEADR